MIDEKQYQTAFEKIEPSKSALHDLLAIPAQPKKHKTRPALLIAAVIAVIAALTATAFGVRNWLQIRSPQPQSADAAEQTEAVPGLNESSTVIDMQVDGKPTYIGFRLSGEEYAQKADPNSCGWLDEVLEQRGLLQSCSIPEDELKTLYTRYYSLTEEDETHEVLNIDILNAAAANYRDFFTNDQINVEKEETFCDMDCAWIMIDNKDELLRTYNLFMFSEQYRCVVVITSNVSFAETEAAAGALKLVDTEVPVNPEDYSVRYAMRFAYLPDNIEITDNGLLSNQLWSDTVALSEEELAGLYEFVTSATIPVNAFEVRRSLDIVLTPDMELCCPDGWTVVKTYKVGIFDAQCMRSDDGDEMIYLWDAESRCEIMLAGSEECPMAELEKIAAGLELVKVPLITAGPLEFNGLAAG